MQGFADSATNLAVLLIYTAGESLEAVFCQPGKGFLDFLCDIRAIGCKNALLCQSVVEVHVLYLSKSIFQVIVVIGKARVRLNPADAAGLQDRADGNTMALMFITL